MDNIKFTIVVVTYNCEKTLEETIISIVNQTYTNKELVIIDGKSNDGTLDIIKKYESHISCFISEPDNGIYDAMNKALKNATGDYLIFLGSDDHFMSYGILKRVSEYINDNNSIYYANVFRPIHKDVYCHKFNKYKLAVKNISHQAIFYSKNVYKKYSYNVHYKTHADYVNNLNIYKSFPFVYIPEVVCYYNEGGVSSKNKDVNFIKDRGKIVCNTVGVLPYLYSCIYNFLRNLIKIKQ